MPEARRDHLFLAGSPLASAPTHPFAKPDRGRRTSCWFTRNVRATQCITLKTIGSDFGRNFHADPSKAPIWSASNPYFRQALVKRSTQKTPKCGFPDLPAQELCIHSWEHS